MAITTTSTMHPLIAATSAAQPLIDNWNHLPKDQPKSTQAKIRRQLVDAEDMEVKEEKKEGVFAGWTRIEF